MKIKNAILAACTLAFFLLSFKVGDALLKQLFFSLSFLGFLFSYRLTMNIGKKQTRKTGSLKKLEADHQPQQSMVA